MNTRYYFPASHSSPVEAEDRVATAGGSNQNEHARSPPLPFLMRVAMRMSRARWFSFLRRVFQYQNGSRSDLASNPFNSGPWLALEFLALVVQIAVITITLVISQKEKPVWPLRIWIVGYNLGNLLSLPLLYWRCRHPHPSHISDLEQQRSSEETRSSYLMNKSRTFLELFFALWFVMGNVWVFDSRYRSFVQAPKLHTLCITLLAWNAVGYSFPFLLFVLLCCCVPLISNVFGYNMNLGSEDRGASDDDLARLPHWRFKEAGSNLEFTDENSECCICLAKYKDKEEVRQLPCSHLFHLRCVDQWLKIISCCPLCKQELER